MSFDDQSICRLCFATEGSNSEEVFSSIKKYLPFLESLTVVSTYFISSNYFPDWLAWVTDIPGWVQAPEDLSKLWVSHWEHAATQETHPLYRDSLGQVQEAAAGNRFRFVFELPPLWAELWLSGTKSAHNFGARGQPCVGMWFLPDLSG